MLNFILRRALILIPFMFFISLISFLVIQLPPGTYVDTYVNNLKMQGGTVSEEQKASIEAMYGLDKPLPVQYGLWITNIVLRGNFGNSFRYNRPVAAILKERVPRTVGISIVAIFLTWIFAIPLGILSAVKQYSFWDHLFTLVSLLGLAVPGFLLALILMYAVYAKTGWMISGLFSPEFRTVPWSIAKFTDLLKNVWLPLLVLSITGVAGIIRVLRASLLDELNKQYVTTARSKGLSEWQLILRYPFRIAINPLLSTLGWMLPAVVGGEIVVSKVLNLPTIGPVLLEATTAQDMYLAGGIVMILSVLTVIGTFISDILLAVNDPRIRIN
ncbi:MAG: ABC transporter permease [Chloroflexi bacterium]|nr:ABC transporter permease [Chloroflexota bacterium]